MKAIASLLRAFRADKRGNFAILFAILLVPLLGAVGVAIDYGVASTIKAKLDAAADASLFAVVNNSALSMTASDAQTAALNTFDSLISGIGFQTVATASVTVTDGSQGRSATLSYVATTPTSFMGLLGVPLVTLSGTSSAVSANPTYIDFYLLLDNTPSMGVGATPADVATMVNNTPDQCAFACHDQSTYPNDYYSLAKSLGVTMRIDVVRSATQQLMDTAGATQIVANEFRVALYTFGSSSASLGLTNISPLSSDLSGAKTAASNIDLITVPYQGYNNDQDTDYDGVLASINTAITTPGDGSVPTAPQKVLFLVADGVADAYYPTSCTQPTTGNGRCQEPVTLAGCTALKNRGVKIAVLYTTYLPLPTNAWYNTWIAPFSSQIGPNMQSCASPGLYFEVSPTQGISAAMQALFQKAVTQARLVR